VGLRVLLLGKRSVYDSFKTSVVSQAINIGKAYNLLHKQMWVKDQAVERGEWPGAFKRIHIYKDPLLTHFNKRPIGFVTLWNIKSPSVNKYSPTNPYDLGLNQLFKGQDPYQAYIGDPKKGIYHDDCYIYPKEMPLDSGMTDVWVYWIKAQRLSGMDGGDVEEYTYYKYTFNKLSALGVQVIDNVELIHYDRTDRKLVNGVYTDVVVHCRKLKISPTGKSDVYYNLGSYGNIVTADYDNSIITDSTCDGLVYGPSANYVNSHNVPIPAWTIWPTDEEMEAQYGKCIHITYHDSRTLSPLLLLGTRPSPEGVLEVVDADGNVVPEISIQQVSSQHAIGWKTKVFANGVAVEYVPYAYESGDSGMEYPAHFKVLPMIYLDTGDLAMPRQKFINEWDTYFDLYVHEDSGGFLVKLAMIIVIIIVTYLSAGSLTAPAAGLFTALAWVGAALSIVGVLTGEKSMMLLGAIIGGIGAIYNSISTGITNMTNQLGSKIFESSMNTLTTEQAAGLATSEVAKMTLGETFSAFVSSAGMSNLFNMGASTISTIMNVSALFNPESMTAPKEAPVEDEVGMQIILDFKDNDSNKDEVMTLIDPAKLLQ